MRLRPPQSLRHRESGLKLAASVGAASLLAAGIIPVALTALADSAAALTPVVDFQSTFESDADGWYAAGSSVAQSTETAAHGGTGVLKAFNRTEPWGFVGHDLKAVIQPGVEYTISGWVKMASGNGQIDLTLNDDGGFHNSGSFHVAVTDSAWVKLSRTYTLAEGPAQETLQAFFANAVDTPFYIDDVTITHAPPMMTVSDVNSTFETDTDGWAGNGVGAIRSTGAVEAHGGNSVLAVDNKTGWGAVEHDIKPIVEPGVAYTISGCR
jgi:endo-1,4-beta-xylanase